MLDKTILEKRVHEITQAIADVCNHHNMLVGRLSEAKELLSSYFKLEVESKIQDCEDKLINELKNDS